MTLIATHEQAIAAIRARVTVRWLALGDLRRVVLAVCDLHQAEPPAAGPDPECWYCNGTGSDPDDGAHCHCRCGFCAGCNQPVCAGACQTIATVATQLGVPGLVFVTNAPQEASPRV